MNSFQVPAALLLVLTLLAPPVMAGFSDAQINRIAQDTTDGLEQCASIPSEYRVDCLRRVFGETAEALKGQRLERDAQRELRRLEVRLARIVQSNVDPAAPKIRSNGYALRAVRQQVLPEALAQSRAAIDAATTVLLKTRPRAYLHYVQIAEVVGSGKVLLRSD